MKLFLGWIGMPHAEFPTKCVVALLAWGWNDDHCFFICIFILRLLPWASVSGGQCNGEGRGDLKEVA